MKKFKWIALLIVVISGLLIGCEEEKDLNYNGGVTIQQYNKLENRMEFDDVIEMLGPPDLINFQENTADKVEFVDEKTSYSWNGVAPGSGVTLYFRDKKLYKKEQAGLE